MTQETIAPSPVLVLSGGRAGDLSTLKYAFVGVRIDEKAKDVQLDLLTRCSLFLAPWEKPTLQHIPDMAGVSILCRHGREGGFALYESSEMTVPGVYQEKILERLCALVLTECVLV